MAGPTDRQLRVDQTISDLAFIAKYPSRSTPAEIRAAVASAIELLRPSSSEPYPDAESMFEDAADAVAGT